MTDCDDDALLQAKKDAVREARAVITQYLATAEQWRYDRVAWAFAVMLGEIPEDSPEPMSPADYEELRRRAEQGESSAKRDVSVHSVDQNTH